MPRRSMERDDPAAVRIAELEDENAALLERLADAEDKAEAFEQRLEQRESEMEELIDAGNGALREPVDYAEPARAEREIVYVQAPAPPPPQPVIFLLGLWAVITARLALDVWRPWRFLEHGDPKLLVMVAFIALCAVFFERWLAAEWRRNAPAGFFRLMMMEGAFLVAIDIYSGGNALLPGNRHWEKNADATFFWITFAFLIVQSPVARWIAAIRLPWGEE